MYYIEVLRTWRVFRTYLFVIAGLYIFVATLFAIWPHGEPKDQGTLYSVGGHAVIVGFICLLFASIVGSSLSRHLDHLDFALTKPRSRTDFAATVLGIDFLGLSVFFLTTALAVALLHIGLGFTHGIAFDASSSFGIAIGFGSVLAWYALVQAVSCAREARGWAVAGVWVAALSFYFLSFLTTEMVGPAFHALIAAINFINPIAYLSTVPFVAISGAAPLSLAAHAFGIYVVAGVAALIALIRWQRVEA